MFEKLKSLVRRFTSADTISLGTPGSLPVKLYKDTDKVLQALGFKWNKGAKGHVNPLEPDARKAINAIIDEDKVVDKAKTKAKNLQFYPTNPQLATMVAELADLEGHIVLEPSAGRGALVSEALMCGAEAVHVVELDQEMVADLHVNYQRSPVTVVEGDFLTVKTGGLLRDRYDRIIANPPFNKGQDTAHIKRMCELLDLHGTVTALVPVNFWVTCGYLTSESDDSPVIRFGAASPQFKVTHDEEVGVDKQSGSSIPLRLIQIQRL